MRTPCTSTMPAQKNSLEPGKPYWERICMGRFDFDSYFRRADEPMTDDMPRPMGIDEEDFDEDEEEEE